MEDLANSETEHDKNGVDHNTNEICWGYLSDLSSEDEGVEWADNKDNSADLDAALGTINHPLSSRNTIPPPKPKRRKLEIPARTARKEAQKARSRELKDALCDIEKFIKSKTAQFVAGTNGLQSKRARSIQICLHMVVNNKRHLFDSSERAAESQGFAAKWGGRMVRQWVQIWIKLRELPKSKQGCHKKVFSLLDDPEVQTELRSYLRTNKWSMNPQKLSNFTKNKLLPDESKKYLHHIVEVEMPTGLKKYLELELFPRIQVKVSRGISLRTARRWLHKEGFKYTVHKKALYFDGHEREDVIAYRQNVFLPLMKEHMKRLVFFEVGNVEKEGELNLQPDQLKLVLLAHDEMTAQSNDDEKMSWVLDGEQPLKKKGVGRGLHQSDVICSTKGWLPEASQTLEYGKNYDGYWNGELFVKQVCGSYKCVMTLIQSHLSQLEERIIPAFERAHGPSYQALIMVDNSQGHSAYSLDALLTSRMNMKPGGKQAKMRNGWHLQNGVKVAQEMCFPGDHPTFPGKPKGMREVLIERGLWRDGLVMKCETRSKKQDDRSPAGLPPGNGGKCRSGATDCCAKRILDLQPDFTEQKSLIQEVIEKAGHLCIFLPKFHCELNFIEFFWGAVKRYLREHCDYTFRTLKENMPKALASVSVETIRKWEHRMKRWMEAYQGGLGAKQAQMQVKSFSSRHYTSHRRVPERIAALFDT
jgi:hypothetical protein